MRRKRSGAEALRIATKAAERAGASVRALDLPEIVAEAWRVHPGSRSSKHIRRSPGNTAKITMRWRRCCATARRKQGTTPADYDEAMGVAGRARHALAKVFDDVDVLLTLSAPGAAPRDWARPATPVTTGYGR